MNFPGVAVAIKEIIHSTICSGGFVDFSLMGLQGVSSALEFNSDFQSLQVAAGNCYLLEPFTSSRFRGGLKII